MRGSFPLNGTYFQVNEVNRVTSNVLLLVLLLSFLSQWTHFLWLYLSIQVFADHRSSHNPIHVEREQLWNLQRRMVFFGTSVPTIFKGCLPCINNSLKLYLYWYQLQLFWLCRSDNRRNTTMLLEGYEKIISFILSWHSIPRKHLANCHQTVLQNADPVIDQYSGP
jgi:hypothetical protein